METNKNKTSYQKTPMQTTDEWYTPEWITAPLGMFDLDPCAPAHPPYKIAESVYTEKEDGTRQPWHGRVWLNPPYSNVTPFIHRMCEHGNGIALLFNRQDTKVWQEKIAKTASGMLFLSGRVKFQQPDGTLKAGATCGSVLIAWGEENARILKESKLNGFYVEFVR